MKTLYVMSFAKMNKSGKTDFDWNFWENFKDTSEIYIGWDSFLIGAKGSLKVGDEVECRDNDSRRLLPCAPKKIYGVCDCNLEDFVKTYREIFGRYCKPPKISFGRKIDGLPWSRMGRIYSIK